VSYLGSKTAQDYFRATIGRFSKDPFQKQMELVARGGDLPLVGAGSAEEELLEYRKKVVSKQLASDLTRAVGEIVKDGFDESTLPAHVVATATSMAFQNPALEFIKNIIEVLQLDAQVDSQVQVLKRSLLSQINVAEYSRAAQWVNPCPTFILPDVFCTECQESRDVNLFYMPPLEDDDGDGGGGMTPSCWACDDCGVPYNMHVIEQRLIALLYRKLVRYQLQDVRCKKTNRVAARCLAPLSDCSAGIKLDTSPSDAIADVELLHGLGKLHDLDDLKNLTQDVLNGYR
jgi:DNA polymerase epsilon subunit 1